MHCPPPPPYAQLGIERVALVEYTPVSQIDLITRDPEHAAALEDSFGIRPFRFARRDETWFSFARLPAIGARAWMEDRGLSFERTTDAIKRRDVRTWIP